MKAPQKYKGSHKKIEVNKYKAVFFVRVIVSAFSSSDRIIE